MNCKEFQARIVDLQELGSGERTDLERHAENCPGCGAKLEGHRGLMAALRTLGAPLHVGGERLTRFAIYRAAPTEPDYDQARLSGEEIQQIESHVRECPRCRLAVDSIITQYHEMDRFLAEAGIPPLELPPLPIAPSFGVLVRDGLDRALSRAKNVLIFPPSYPAGVALGVLFGIVVMWTSPWLRDPYHQLTFVEATQTSFLTRDAGSALTDGISLMNEGRYSEAITLLEPFSDGESAEFDDRLRNYAHYLSGLAWVYEARTEVLGRVLAYSESRLDRAITHLRTVTESSQNGRVLEDAYWLLGKAHLMKQDADRAIEALTAVEHIEGRRAVAARQLIEAIAEVDINGG